MADTYDAGWMGCGELVIELLFRLRALSPGDVVHVIARDAGAPEDLPAWCRMTGHTLIHVHPPDFHIQRRARP